jgi:hypothetical protein
MLSFLKRRSIPDKKIEADHSIPRDVEINIYDVVIPEDEHLTDVILLNICPGCNKNCHGDGIPDGDISTCVGVMWECPECETSVYFHKAVGEYTFVENAPSDIKNLL